MGSGCGVTGVCGVPGGGAHWALEHWYVTLCPKKVISDLNRPKIIPFDTQNYYSISKNVSKIIVLYLRDFLWKISEIFFEIL